MSGTLMTIKKEEKSRNSAADSFNHTAGHENHTGIPIQLKELVEQSTGMSLNDVRVHYNSILPAKLDAFAYTKGTQVEISPGQEQHLPHELGHVIQQKLGIVRANAVHSSGIMMNVDKTLERQADEIGAGKRIFLVQGIGNATVQRCGYEYNGLTGYALLAQSSNEEYTEEEDTEEEDTKEQKNETKKDDTKNDNNTLKEDPVNNSRALLNMSETIKKQMYNDLLGFRLRYIPNNESDNEPKPGNFAVAYAYIYSSQSITKKRYNGFSKIRMDSTKVKYLHKKKDIKFNFNIDEKIKNIFMFEDDSIIDDTDYFSSIISQSFEYLYPQETKNNKINDNKETGYFDRSVDAEAKILEDISYDIKPMSNMPDIKGVVFLCSELNFCESCEYVIYQFKNRYPNVDVKAFYLSDTINPESQKPDKESLNELSITKFIEEWKKKAYILKRLKELMEKEGNVKGAVPPDIKKSIAKQKDLKTLANWYNSATAAQSIKDFKEKTGI